MAARQAFSHEDLSEDSTTTSGSWPTTATFTFTPDASSDYWIFFSCLFANGSGTAAHYGEASVYHDQGATSVGYWAHRSQETSSPQDWCSVFCVHKSTFGASPGAQDYIVSINSSHAGDTTKIKDIRFLAIKADAADQYAVQDASASTTSTSYTTRTTLTFTPASTGDYLLISSAVLTADTASNAHGARLNHSGGSIYGENLTYPKATWLYNTWAGAAKINLAASSNTFTLQYKTSANNAYIEQARILALRLDKFDNAYVAQDFTGGNSTSASDQDYLTLTQTPLALDHAILAVAAFRTASTSVSGYLNVCKGGTNYTETPREGVNTAGYFHAGVAVKETLAASSTTWKWRARAETAGTTVYADDLLIAVLQLDASPTTVTKTASFAAAVQKAIANSSSANAAVMKTISAPVDAGAAVQKALAALISADAAAQATLNAGAGADTAVRSTAQLLASLDLAVAVLQSAQTQINAAVAKAIAVGLGSDAAVQKAFVASASLTAAVQALHTIAGTLDVAVQATVTRAAAADVYITAASAQLLLATLGAAVRAVLSAGAGADAAVQVARSTGATADVAIFVGLGKAVDAGAAVLASLSAGITASAAVLAERSGATGADAAVQAVVMAGVATSAAVLRQWSGTFSADAALSLLMSAAFSADAALSLRMTGTLSADALILGGGRGPVIDLAGIRPAPVGIAGVRVLANRLDGLRLAVTRLIGRG
jgi:hypothetical protein